MIGTTEIILVSCVVMVLFGAKKLPEFARSIGQSKKEFQKAMKGVEDETKIDEV